MLKSYPTDKLDLKPHERSKSARDLAWNVPAEEKLLIEGSLTGTFDFANYPAAPATMAEIIKTYEEYHKAALEKVKQLPDGELNTLVKFMVAPKQLADVCRGDLLWMAVMDKVHHRGQFSVYLRMAGGRVPSIYGPTADEPWT